MAVIKDLERTDAPRSTASTQGLTAAIVLETTAMVACVFAPGIADLAASTAAMAGPATAASNARHALRSFRVAARVSKVELASSASATDTAPAKIAAASLISAILAVVALGASTGPGPKIESHQSHLQPLSLERWAGSPERNKGTIRPGAARRCPGHDAASRPRLKGGRPRDQVRIQRARRAGIANPASVLSAPAIDDQSTARLSTGAGEVRAAIGDRLGTDALSFWTIGPHIASAEPALVRGATAFARNGTRATSANSRSASARVIAGRPHFRLLTLMPATWIDATVCHVNSFQWIVG